MMNRILKKQLETNMAETNKNSLLNPKTRKQYIARQKEKKELDELAKQYRMKHMR